jgi:hypothetical protein
MQHQRRHDLWPAVGLNLGIHQVIGNNFSTFDACNLAGRSDLEIIA